MSELAMNPMFPTVPAPRTGVRWRATFARFLTTNASPVAPPEQAPRVVVRRRSAFLDDARLRREMYRD